MSRRRSTDDADPPMTIRRVLAEYPQIAVQSAAPLGGAGGFSGARLWRLETAAGPQCLRRWPAEHPSESRLKTIHQLLQSAAEAGIPVPAPETTRTGATWVRDGGGLFWELAPWMPGRACFSDEPSARRLESAMRTLAELHNASAAWRRLPEGPSPAIHSRWQMLRETPERVAALQRQMPRCPPELAGPAAEILRGAARGSQIVRQRFADAPRIVAPLLWVMADVWHDHVLFVGDRVSGLIDFGAIRIDAVSLDLARLLGSLIEDDAPAWQSGLEAYERTRPLTASQRELAYALDQAAVVLSGLNWLQWTILEGRQFESLEMVASRLRAIARRLQAMLLLS